MPLADLRRYRPEVVEPADFGEFWAGQLQDARAGAAEPVFVPTETAARHAAVFDVTFPGYAGDPVRAWLLVPHKSEHGKAAVVQYIGYGGGRGDHSTGSPGAAPATRT